MSADQIQIGGSHYQREIQPWEVMQEYMTFEEFQGFLWGNVIKYSLRWKGKNLDQDLMKARHYIDKLLETRAEAAVRSIP